MKISIRSVLDYTIDGIADLLVQVEAAEMPHQAVRNARFDPGVTEHFSRISAEDGIGTRVWLRSAERLNCTYTAEVEVSRRREDITTMAQDPVHKLPHEAVRYLMASRYCPSDEFQSFVGAEFGSLSGGACIKAMSDWIEDCLSYVPGSSHAGTTALDTFVQRRGICRDYAHLLISLARASAIPARMVSAYGPEVTPMDFHAVVEVWLDGGWRLVDPSGMSAPDRLAIIGVGRDAADIAFLTSYGFVTLQEQVVDVTETA
ncbi:transglutaminase superfamily protein [Palleronia aestuarii]|uniref:Transglutaminase superfamily protein n=1 Tax=Palleronia aestuarii TaxID=568105 RepID=A0A2W7NM75_9RHOB|nr:transglutaminase family protein [Palleronia aestuarii]PZX17744.1 transglutaminase superfamily protein [Palleronia aestuarii]